MPGSIRLLQAILVASLATVPAAADQPQHPASTNAPVRNTGAHGPTRLAKAAEVTASKGFDAKLPPHISTLLRVANEQECPVKQSVTRSGSIVQGFDVSVANKNDIIIFTVNEGTNDQSLYLTQPDGTLRRVVTVSKGVGAEIRITDKEKKAFHDEVQFWLDRLAPAPKPGSAPQK